MEIINRLKLTNNKTEVQYLLYKLFNIKEYASAMAAERSAIIKTVEFNKTTHALGDTLPKKVPSREYHSISMQELNKVLLDNCNIRFNPENSLYVIPDVDKMFTFIKSQPFCTLHYS